MHDSYALITGASSGIGEAFARALAEQSQSLILVARSSDRLDSLKTELQRKHSIIVHTIVMDLAVAGSAQGLWEQCHRDGWIVSLLVNNAGFGRIGSLLDYSLDDYRRMMALNMNALMELTYLFVRDMKARNSGGIINVASTAAFQSTPFLTVYSATKAFVLSFSEALAAELVGSNVRLLALCRGPTRT